MPCAGALAIASTPTAPGPSGPFFLWSIARPIHQPAWYTAQPFRRPSRCYTQSSKSRPHLDFRPFRDCISPFPQHQFARPLHPGVAGVHQCTATHRGTRHFGPAQRMCAPATLVTAAALSLCSGSNAPPCITAHTPCNRVRASPSPSCPAGSHTALYTRHRPPTPLK